MLSGALARRAQVNVKGFIVLHRMEVRMFTTTAYGFLNSTLLSNGDHYTNFLSLCFWEKIA